MHLFKYRLINETVKLNGVLLVLKRFKTRVSKFKKTGPCVEALKHFDDFYKAVFGNNWPSVRLGLLSRPKTVAVINNFGDIIETEKFLKHEGAMDLRPFLEVQKRFVINLEDNSLKTKQDVIDIGEVISHQLLEEKEKESSLHPEGLEFQARVEKENEKEDEKDEFVYNPDDATTSLEFDLSKSVIDTSRLILPDSVEGDSKLMEFLPATKLRGAESYIAESEYYKYYRFKTSTPFTIEEELELDFPKTLKVYTFDRGDVTEIPDSNRSAAETMNFLKVDGAELLTALVLGAKKNDLVLDLCSKNGNIAYCILQTLKPAFLLCANAEDKTMNLFRDHLYNFSTCWNDMLHITSEPVDETESRDLFDKVLVDVLSTNDKNSLFEEEDNIFHTKNIKERLTLPESQCAWLMKGLKLVRPGGAVIYTTTTLSPIQNDGVVTEALHNLWEESRMEFIIKDLTPALQHTTEFFKYGNYLNLKYGTLVVPFVPVNFGPRYICKIVKKEREGENLPSTETTFE